MINIQITLATETTEFTESLKKFFSEFSVYSPGTCARGKCVAKHWNIQ